MIAICPPLIAGRKRLNGEKRAELSKDFPSFLISISAFFSVACFSIFVFCFMLKKRLAVPNNPVRRGSKGSFNSIPKTIYPSTPVSKKTPSPENFFSSRRIIFKDTAISPRAITDPWRFLIKAERKYKGKIRRRKINKP